MDASFPWFDSRRRDFHLARYEFASRWAPGAQVLDCACGTGYGASRLVKAGAARVLGLDREPSVLAYARRYHGSKQTYYLCGDAIHLPFASGAFDLIVSFETIEHVPDDEAMLSRFAGALKPEGRAVISTPNEWPLEVSPHHVRTYSMKILLDRLNKYFGHVECYNQNSGTDWTYNHGQPAGIWPTTEENQTLAECFIVVCREPRIG
ncbi:MAG: hypothetical protein AMXMBFR7_39380 [Planctomycetota bacterium]